MWWKKLMLMFVLVFGVQAQYRLCIVPWKDTLLPNGMIDSNAITKQKPITDTTLVDTVFGTDSFIGPDSIAFFAFVGDSAGAFVSYASSIQWTFAGIPNIYVSGNWHGPYVKFSWGISYLLGLQVYPFPITLIGQTTFTVVDTMLDIHGNKIPVQISYNLIDTVHVNVLTPMHVKVTKPVNTVHSIKLPKVNSTHCDLLGRKILDISGQKYLVTKGQIILNLEPKESP